ncbi:MAG: PEP-CTERM sorting domain-containing protein [Gemmatales bacterium]
MRRLTILFCMVYLASQPFGLHAQTPTWGMYNGNAQHDGVSTVPLQTLNVVKWSTPVDLQPQYNNNDLLIHYGSPLATAGNTIVVPVKTGATGNFQVEGRQGYDGSLLWTQTTDYITPPSLWTPSYAPSITPQNRLYFSGEGGTIFYRDDLNSTTTVANPNRLAFYDVANYASSPAAAAAARANVFINTPITSDAFGNIFFGFQVTGTSAVTIGNVTLQPGGGIGRISNTGVGSYVQASTAAGDAAIKKVVTNAAPALSPDGSTVYVPVTNASGFGSGYLVSLDSSNLNTTGKVALKDVKTGNGAILPDIGSASPMVAPNGDVYYGVLENPFSNSKGWMLHFDSTLATTKIPSRFGWDNTASIVDKSLVASYTGNSPYLIMTKYNNYASTGGDGVNKLGIFDPFVSEIDPLSGQSVMKEIMSIAGVTPDPTLPAVREWCINSAAVDPFHKSILVNSEDGKSYVWDLTTNTLVQAITLTPGIGEAYTPTMIGPDGTGYAINNGILFAMAATAVPEPGTVALAMVGLAAGGFTWWSRCRRQRQLANADLQG